MGYSVYDIGIGSGRQQNPKSSDVAHRTRHKSHKRSSAYIVEGIDLGTALNEDGNNFCLSGEGRRMKGVNATITRQLYVGSGLKEGNHHFERTQPGSHVKRTIIW